jgi:hypothetical protein
MWSSVAPAAVTRFTASADIEGLLAHGAVRVTGLSMPHDEATSESAVSELVEFLRAQFPSASIQVVASSKVPPPPTEPHLDSPGL